MKRRNVVARKSETVSAPGSAEDGLSESHPNDGAAQDMDALKQIWARLMADLGAVVLGAYEADPHRFDGDVVGDDEKTFGLAFGVLVCGGAMVGAVLFGTPW